MMLADLINSPFIMIPMLAALTIGLIFILTKAPIFKDYEAKSAAPHKKNTKRKTEEDEQENLTPQEKSGFYDYVNQGNEHLHHGRTDQALSCFQVAAKIKEDEPVLHFKIGRIYVQKQDYHHAIIAFQNVLSLQDDHIEAMYELARVFQTLHQNDEAFNMLEQVLKINPLHEESLKLKVKLFEQLSRYEEMLPILQSLMSISKYGHHRKYRLQYAEALSSLNKQEEAIQEYLKLIEDDSINKSMYEAHIAHLYFDMGQYGKAIEFYRRVFYANDPLGKDEETRSRMAAALCNEGVRYFTDLGDIDSAIQYYQEALQYDKVNPDIYYNLGKSYLKQGHLENARKQLIQAYDLSPKDSSCAYELATLEDQLGDIDGAIRHYKAVLMMQPHHSLAAYGVGSLYGIQGNFDKCVEYLTLAINANPEFEDAIYNLGVALEKQNQVNKAIKMYKKVLSINASHEQARSNLLHLQHH